MKARTSSTYANGRCTFFSRILRRKCCAPFLEVTCVSRQAGLFCWAACGASSVILRTQVIIEGLRHFILTKKRTIQERQDAGVSRHGLPQERCEPASAWRPGGHHQRPRLPERRHRAARWRHACILETGLLTRLMKLDSSQLRHDAQYASSAQNELSNDAGLLMLLQDQAVGSFLVRVCAFLVRGRNRPVARLRCSCERFRMDSKFNDGA